MESTERYFKAPTDHFFLLGPRGTGKTWLTQRRFPDSLRVDLLEPEIVSSLSVRPERLRELIAPRPEVRQVVIDEVQKLPELLQVAHYPVNPGSGIGKHRI